MSRPGVEREEGGPQKGGKAWNIVDIKYEKGYHRKKMGMPVIDNKAKKTSDEPIENAPPRHPSLQGRILHPPPSPRFRSLPIPPNASRTTNQSAVDEIVSLISSAVSTNPP